MSLPVRPAFLLLGLAGLSGCGFGSQEKFPPACPSLALLDDAADVTRYRGTGHDVTDVVLDGRITAVPADCRRDGTGFVKTTLRVRADLMRGNASTTRSASVGYLVSVTDGDRIVDQQDYTLNAAFASNVERVAVSGDDIELRFPVTRTKNASAYKIYVGFRLTPEELDINRKRGPR